MANFLETMIKDAIKEAVGEAMQGMTGATPPADAQESGSNSVNDKIANENEDTAKQGAQSDTNTPKPEDKTISTADFQKMVKDEVGAYMTKIVNSAPATKADDVDVDAVYCDLLGFPKTKKGD